MPEISLLGWFHTAVGIASMIVGVYTLARYKVIRLSQRSGMLYLVGTLLTALSALGIYQQGGFNLAHALAVLTLLALLVGGTAERTQLFRIFSPYVQAISYSGTLLFHTIPAITDGLRRLPVDDPIVTSLEDPLLLNSYLAALIAYLLLVGYQTLWLYRNRNG